MGTRHRDDHRGLADGEPTDAVEEGHPTDLGVMSASGSDDVPQPGCNPLNVRLVLDGVDTVATFCVVTHRADEDHHRPAVRADDPGLHGIDRKCSGRELDPFLTRRARRHGAMLEPAPPPARRPGPSRTPTSPTEGPSVSCG